VIFVVFGNNIEQSKLCGYKNINNGNNCARFSTALEE